MSQICEGLDEERTKAQRREIDLMIQESIIADFKRRGFQVHSSAEPDLCNDDPTRVLMRQILGAFAEYERKCIVSKLRSARQRAKTKHGRCEGRKHFGFRPGEQTVLERMHVLHSEGLGLSAITRRLNTEGFKTRSGGKWFPATVARILERPA